MNKKAVFFDIDGTLYDHETGISDSTKEGIARLKENGHYAFICTGRSMAAVFDPELLGMGFDGIVAGCGTYVTVSYTHLDVYKRQAGRTAMCPSLP